MAITSVKNRQGGRGRNLSRLYSSSSSVLLSGFFSHSRSSSMIRARGKSVSGNMGQSSILTGRAVAQCSQKGSSIFLDKISPESGDISPHFRRRASVHETICFIEQSPPPL